MTRPASAEPLLDAETIQFITRRVSMAIAGRGTGNVPSSARGCGCRVTPDGRLLTVFVSRPQAAALLRDIEANGAIAVVFSRPTTHRTMQFKGSDAREVPLAPGDAQLVAAFVGSFVVELTPLGHAAPFVHAVLAARPEDLTAIAFTPSDGFAQTPGPGAGAPLPGR
ncbi:MAG TPA: hypothetical protein VLU54_02930 [Casimicrobiaceae bacterium]|nr:hypothetical protein [Casimicrobiaceae bacterium]